MEIIWRGRVCVAAAVVARFFLRVFAVADERGANHDQDDTGPADGRDAFPENQIAANVANTKLKAVSGQRRLISLRAIKISRQKKNNASKTFPARFADSSRRP